MHLLTRINRYLRRSGMPETRFGRVVLNDPRFVRDLRDGRDPRGLTVAKVEAWLAAHERTR